jgi:hypothetical protein
MSAVPFGQFSLIDMRGESSGAVIIAPEYILLQRAPSAAVHDLSYLVVWSGPRTAAVVRELELLAGNGKKAVDTSTPELKHMLHSIEPKATALFRGAGQCSRLFARRQLKAALQTAAVPYPRQHAS